MKSKAAALLKAESYSRSPCGERGLKSDCLGVVECGVESLPVRGAWVEMQVLRSLITRI